MTHHIYTCLYFHTFLGMYDVFGRGSYSLEPHRVIFIIMGVMFAFAISHWEKYNTGVLYLPWGYDLSQLVSTDMFALKINLCICVLHF